MQTCVLRNRCSWGTTFVWGDGYFDVITNKIKSTSVTLIFSHQHNQNNSNARTLPTTFATIASNTLLILF